MFNLEEKKGELTKKFTHLVTYNNKNGYSNGKNYHISFPIELSKIMLFDNTPKILLTGKSLLVFEIKHESSVNYHNFIDELQTIVSNNKGILGFIRNSFNKNKDQIKIKFFSNTDTEPHSVKFKNVLLTSVENRFSTENENIIINTKLTFKFSDKIVEFENLSEDDKRIQHEILEYKTTSKKCLEDLIKECERELYEIKEYKEKMINQVDFQNTVEEFKQSFKENEKLYKTNESEKSENESTIKGEKE